MEGNLATVPLEVLDGDADGDQLAAEVGDEETLTVATAELCGVLDGAKIGTKSEPLVLGLDVKGGATSLHIKLSEDGDAERVDVKGARAGNNKVVVKERVGKRADVGGQERLLGGDGAEESSVKAILLTLLTNDGCYTSHNTSVSGGGGGLADVLKSAHDHCGESFGDGNGIMDIGGGELVFAGQRRKLLELVQSVERIERVELFLLR